MSTWRTAGLLSSFAISLCGKSLGNAPRHNQMFQCENVAKKPEGDKLTSFARKKFTW